MASLKLKQLEQYLQTLDQFSKPKVMLEQYATFPHIASRILYTAQASFGDIEGKVVADLGCGCGSLALGALLLEADFCFCFEIDADAINILKENSLHLEINNYDVIQCDVLNYLPHRFIKSCDTVIMNPPFGTKVKGVDVEFLKCALQIARTAVYSLHKTSTRNHIVKSASTFGVKATVLAELKFDLPATYKFHKKSSVDIQVDLIRFSFD